MRLGRLVFGLGRGEGILGERSCSFASRNSLILQTLRSVQILGTKSEIKCL